MTATFIPPPYTTMTSTWRTLYSALLACYCLIAPTRVAHAASTQLTYSAPSVCPDQPQVLDRLSCEGLPPGAREATLRIVQRNNGFEASLTTQLTSEVFTDQVTAETCEGAVTWGVFVWNAMFPPGCPVEVKNAGQQPLESGLRVAAGGIVNMLQSFRPGVQLAFDADLGHVRLGVSGTYYQDGHALTNTTQKDVSVIQQAFGVQLCGFSGAPSTPFRIGLCAVAGVNWMQVDSEYFPSNAVTTGRHTEVGLALTASRKIFDFALEAALSAGAAPDPMHVKELGGGLSGVPRNDTYATFSLRAAFDALAARSSTPSTRPILTARNTRQGGVSTQ